MAAFATAAYGAGSAGWAAACPAGSTGEHARSWLIRHGATEQLDDDEFVKILQVFKSHRSRSAGTFAFPDRPTSHPTDRPSLAAEPAWNCD
jgi:hypothetical protein